MDFSGRRRKREEKLRQDLSSSHRLLMYKEPPLDNISLEDFEEFAIQRLKVLRDVETFGIRYKKSTKEYTSKLWESLRRFLPNAYKVTVPDPDSQKKEFILHLQERQKDIKKDNISHFILRLAYCRSEELRRWFLAQEMELFRFRFVEENEVDKAGKITGNQIEEFLKENNLHYTPIELDQSKDRDLIDNLVASGSETTTPSVLAMDYFKVRFENVLDLVRTRKVFLREGYAYVPRSELVSIIVNVFRTHLSHALAMTARALPYLEEDERLLPRLTNLSKQYVGQDYTQRKADGADVSLDQLDSLSRNDYPLCMRQLHQALRENHHLRHGGRMQYGLFLKGIGITLEEALLFWRSEFAKMMDIDKFDKQYAYNIRHNYGKEGKRADYTPYSCMKIIMSNQPGSGDHHGCPFRHTDSDLLRQKLLMYKVPQEGVNQILSLVQESHYQLACTRYFELTHGVSASSPFSHPNQYFEESRRATKDGQANVYAKQEAINKTGVDKARQTSVKKEESYKTENEDFDMDIETDEITSEDLAEIDMAIM